MKIAKVFPTVRHLNMHLDRAKEYSSVRKHNYSALDIYGNEVLFFIHDEVGKMRGVNVAKVEYFYKEIPIPKEVLEVFSMRTYSSKGEEKKPTYCQHVWETYVGLSESFIYCIKCDKKRK